jgi:predicted nuclease of predicted toxin-antitoxin system
VKPLDFPLLTDENITPDVVVGLRARGYDLQTAWDEQPLGRPDVDVLERATSEGRVVTRALTFGGSAVRTGTPFVGIFYRPRTHSRSTSDRSPAESRQNRARMAE